MKDPSVKRVLKRYGRKKTARPEDLEGILEQMGSIHRSIQAWAKSFPRVLREAQKDVERKGWVWQDPFVGFFERYDPYQSQLWELGRKLEAIGTPAAMRAKAAVDPPREARVNRAIGDIDFALHPETGQDHIMYPEAKLRAWFSKFSEWTAKSSKLLKSIS